MRRTVLYLLLIVCQPVSAQTITPADYIKYVGYYLLEVTDDDTFEHFIQIEVGVLYSKDSIPYLQGTILFYGDTLLAQSDTECTVPFQHYFISTDSFYFATEECLGEAYEFVGKFLAVPTDEFPESEGPILEGILIHRKHQKFYQQAFVKFYWTAGC